MTIIPKMIFRGYDIRGIAETELTNDVVDKIARAYATVLVQRKITQVVIGRDNRISGERISNQFIKTLNDCGLDVIDLGLSLAQIVYFGAYYYRTKGYVMISASHNPKEYNGFKIGIGYSDTMVTDELQELRIIAETEKFQTYNRKGTKIEENIFEAYKSDILKRFIDKPFNFKVVIDTGNDTSGMFLPIILKEAGCEVIEQNTNLDGNYPLGTPDPTENEFLERLAKGVIEHNADLGFAYDPDGDRLGIVDHKGKPVWNDVLVALFARDVLDQMKGCNIVYNTLCSKMVKEVIEQSGGTPIMWYTGHSFIKAKVKEARSPFGGELSGHFFFMDNFYGHDDSANATLRLLSYLQRHKLNLKDAVNTLPKYISSPEIKLGLADDIKFDFIKNIIAPELTRLFPEGIPDMLEGIRLEIPNGMIMIRASQNGPYITIKFESKNHDEYESLRFKVGTLMKKYPEIDFSHGVNITIFEDL